MIRNAAIALLFGLMLGCAHSRDKVTQPSLQGSVTFRGTLPADSILRIHLIETIPAPASTNILAVDQLNFEGGSPVAFSIRYNAARIRSENSYTLLAKAYREADGMLIMKSEDLRVLNPGGPTNGIVLVLAPAK